MVLVGSTPNKFITQICFLKHYFNEIEETLKSGKFFLSTKMRGSL